MRAALIAVTYTPTVGTAAALDAVIVRRSKPVLRGGQIITIHEDHYTGMVAIADRATEPQIGDTLTTADAVVYQVDNPPTRREAWWELTLRKQA
jgi:predicted RNA-binding protein (virulence factor B family)